MTLNTETVNIDVPLPDGTVFTSVSIHILLSGPDFDGTASIAPEPIIRELDTLGQGTVELWANDNGVNGTHYTAVIHGILLGEDVRTYTLGRFQVLDGSGPVNLSDLLGAGGAIVDPAFYSVLTEAEYNAAIAAQAAAEQAAADAEADADRAGTNALSVVDRAYFAEVADLIADNDVIIGYSGDGAQFTVQAGDYITAGSLRYKVAASDAVEYTDATVGGVRLVKQPSNLDQARGGQIGILRAATYASFTSSASDPTPFRTIGNVLYGFHGTNLYSQIVEGGVWTLVGAIPSTPVAMELMSDGEMVFVTSSGIYKSTDWGGSVSWTLKQSNNGGNAIFRPFSTAGSNGVKMIVSECATGSAGSGWEDSTNAWATFDSGDNWTAVYDAATEHPGDYTDTHLHGACYDIDQDAFFLVEGHTSSRGIYWSPATSGSISWTRIDDGTLGAGASGGGEPTNIFPTEHGIVCASDGFFTGLWVVQRGATTSDMMVEPLMEWPTGRGGVNGFGECAHLDPETGIIYFGFYSNYVDGAAYNPLTIFASNGSEAGIVWEGAAATVPGSGEVNYFSNIVVTPWKTIIAVTSSASAVGIKKVEGRISNGGGIDRLDRGVIGGGRLSYTAYQSRGMACGDGAVVSVAGGCAVGMSANVSGTNGTAIGSNAVASGPIGVAVGAFAEAQGSTSTVIGTQSIAGQNGVLIGPSRDMSGSENFVSIGAVQTITGGTDNFVAIGHSVTVQHPLTVALGTFAQCTGTESVALGHSSVAAHARGVALGRSSTTTADYQVAIDTRHVEMLTVPSTPSAPASGAVRLYSDVSGGKQRLMAVFPSGAAQQVAIEP